MTSELNIVKYEPPKPPCDPFEIFLAAMFLMYMRAPLKRNADVDGMYELGEIGGVAEKRFRRTTPYSVAEAEAEFVPEREERLLVLR